MFCAEKDNEVYKICGKSIVFFSVKATHTNSDHSSWLLDCRSNLLSYVFFSFLINVRFISCLNC
jgi:hypothetical protein